MLTQSLNLSSDAWINLVATLNLEIGKTYSVQNLSEFEIYYSFKATVPTDDDPYHILLPKIIKSIRVNETIPIWIKPKNSILKKARISITQDPTILPTESNNGVPVNIQDQISPPIGFYLYVNGPAEDSVVLTADANVFDTILNVNDTTPVVPLADAITIFEGTKIYQSLVKAKTGTTITLATPLDSNFTTACDIHIGPWNLNLNGSVTIIDAHMHGPEIGYYDIYGLTIHITDDAAMDSEKFGGISALTNGIFFRINNSVVKNLALVTNNHGFSEFGFTIDYDPKAPAGQYGFSAIKNYHIINGIAIRLGPNDLFELLIRDNLTALTKVTCTIHGHFVKD